MVDIQFWPRLVSQECIFLSSTKLIQCGLNVNGFDVEIYFVNIQQKKFIKLFMETFFEILKRKNFYFTSKNEWTTRDDEKDRERKLNLKKINPKVKINRVKMNRDNKKLFIFDANKRRRRVELTERNFLSLLMSIEKLHWIYRKLTCTREVMKNFYDNLVAITIEQKLKDPNMEVFLITCARIGIIPFDFYSFYLDLKKCDNKLQKDIFFKELSFDLNKEEEET